MGKTIAEKIIAAHLVSGDMTPGSEIALRIDQASKIPIVLSLGYTNGHEQYFVTESAFCRGGYEVGVHKLACIQERVDNADWYLMKETVNNLNHLL